MVSAQAITLRLPELRLPVWPGANGQGMKGQQVYLPVYVDSLTSSDSIGAFQVKIVCDTGRIRATGINTVGTLTGGPRYDLLDGHYVPGGFVISIIGDGTFLITGKGLLLNVVFQIIDDTAGLVPVSFDPMWTEFDKFDGPNINKVTGVASISGGIRFVPVCKLQMSSDSVTYSRDTVVTAALTVVGTRGDRIKSLALSVHSTSRNFLFADIDTSATLLTRFAKDGWWQWSTADSGRVAQIVAARTSSDASMPETTVVARLKMLVKHAPSYANTLSIDSITITGFEDQFEDSVTNGVFYLRYVPEVLAVSNDASSMPVRARLHLFPNPTTDVVSVELSNGVTSSVVNISNALGQIVLSCAIPSGNAISIHTGTLPAGPYQVQWCRGKEVDWARLDIVH